MKDALSLEQKYQSLQAQFAQLQAVLTEKDALLAEKEQRIAYLQERLSILLAKRYKAQSEQLKYLQGQLFDEAELEADIAETRQALEALATPEEPAHDTTGTNRPAAGEKPKRNKLPAHLRRVDVIIDVSAEDRQAMGEDWRFVGFETSEQLAVRQREYYVKVIQRKKYVRNTAPAEGTDTLPAGIVVAPPARVILPRAIADASLLADVLCSKFIDAMSFYRTEKRLRREGIDIGYSTLCDWPLQLYQRLGAFERLFYDALGQCQLWHLDETTLQVLGEPGRDNRQISYLWGVRTGPPDPAMVLFHYHTRRNYEALEQWLRPCLAHFNGVIVSDEHGPYNTLVRQHAGIRAHGGCLAHCRRKFADAAKGRRHGSDAHRVLQKIALIYTRERKGAHLTGSDRLQARREHVKPQMDELKRTLDALAPKYLHQGAMRTAIGYALNNWHKFTACLDHPELPLDNNAMEQAIRPFTLGRKNWIFAGSPRGANASAFIYSLIESARANGLEPHHYLCRLFELYPLATSDDERRRLLPWNFKHGD